MRVAGCGQRRRMTQYLADGIQVSAGVYQEARRRVTEVMPANMFHPRLLPSRVKPFDKQAVGAVQG